MSQLDIPEMNMDDEEFAALQARACVHDVVVSKLVAGVNPVWVTCECTCYEHSVIIRDSGTEVAVCPNCGTYLRLFPIETLEDLALYESGAFDARGMLC